MLNDDVYDYVVVGGGSSGCTVAGRLIEARAGRVLVLEAGDAAETNPETMSADHFIESFANDRLMLDRLSELQPGCGGRRLYAGTGRGMGGSGAVNGMVYTRGDKRDFARWPKGWQWHDVLPSYEALEERLRVRTRPQSAFSTTCLDSALAAGFTRKDQLNDGVLCGFMGYQQMNYEGDRRRSSYMAFLHDVRDENLEIQANALVHRIVFDAQKRATAVEYEHRGTMRTARVRKEVILCAGACETPKLLMLSGVGEAEHLAGFGIPLVLDSPGIGKNLQDHLSVPLFYRGKRPSGQFYTQLYGFERNNAAAPLADKQADTCYSFFVFADDFSLSIKPSLPALVLPPALFHNKLLRKGLKGLVDLAARIPALRRFVSQTYAIIVVLGKPQSRGVLRLASRDPRAQASIDPAYLTHPQDIETLVGGVLKGQAIAQQQELSEWGNKPLSEAASTQNREVIEKAIRKTGVTVFHFSGTCRMGEDDAAPVDPQLRLKGTRNVRVADASIIPEIPVSALNGPSMLIGQRAAELILQESRQSSGLGLTAEGE